MATLPETTYSEAVYLFAETCIPDRSKLFNYDTHPTGEKISVKPLCHMMILSALVFGMEKEYISLSVKDVKKLFIFPGKDIFVKRLKELDPEIDGIEKALISNIKDESPLNKAVYHILDEDESSPWGQIIRKSKDSLIQKGYLMMEKERKNIFSAKRHLFGEKNRSVVTETYKEALQKIKMFSSKDELYKLTQAAIKNGVASRLEQADTSD